ncbi:hypothetical protein GCK32_003115, partial [Trichostrongylus colubriformis]
SCLFAGDSRSKAPVTTCREELSCITIRKEDLRISYLKKTEMLYKTFILISSIVLVNNKSIDVQVLRRASQQRHFKVNTSCAVYDRITLQFRPMPIDVIHDALKPEITADRDIKVDKTYRAKEHKSTRILTKRERGKDAFDKLYYKNPVLYGDIRVRINGKTVIERKDSRNLCHDSYNWIPDHGIYHFIDGKFRTMYYYPHYYPHVLS